MTTADTVMRPTTRHYPPAGLVWVGLLLVLMAAGFAAWIYQMSQGLQVTAMRDNVMWGLYIVTFMFFVGLSAGGLIVASAGRLFGVGRFKPIVRLAVLEATVAIIAAASFIVPDLGHPERLLNLVLHANVTSPMIWDITIIVVYLVLSLLYVWLYMRRDLAARGSRLALGTRDTSAAARARDDRRTWMLAWIALPAAVLVHSITAWIFGLQISRGFWYTAIMAPLFISSALVSGLALVLVLALLVRRLGRVSFEDGLASFLGALLGVFIAVQAFLVFCEVLAGYYPGVASDAVRHMLDGPYAPLFGFEVLVGLVIPFLLLAGSALRRRPGVVGLAAALALAGIFAHRLEIILVGLNTAPLPYGPGTAIGTPLDNGTSFAVSSAYVPTGVEILIALGLVAFAALLFTIGVLVLPLRGEGAS
jgi:molybdopterin-containing oxidoreductase family membrane subunit